MEETKTIELSPRFFKLIAIFIAVVTVFMLGELMYQFQALPQNFPETVSVTGEGKAFAKPDIAEVSFGTHTQAAKSQDAVNENNKIMDAVTKAMKDLGVEDKDIQTTLYSLMPLYDYTERGRIFKGYSLDQQVQVKIRNFDSISNILDAATSKGANTVGDLQFTIDDPERVKTEARAKAIEQAKEKAASLMSQSGLSIVKLISVSEGFTPVPQPLFTPQGVAARAESVPPSIQPGQLEVDTTVTLTYRVK